MQKLRSINSQVMPLAMNDVDTDLIIPAQYLTAISKDGYGANVFRRLRDADPQFIFNQKAFAKSNILLTLNNFGCGSSREHAVWALQEAGFKAIIAISFADIFYQNSAKNGLLLIKLPEKIINSMMQYASQGNYFLNIDLESQTIQSSHEEIFNFEVDAFRKHCFLNGLDDLDYLLSHQEEIKAYFANNLKSY